MVDWVKVPWDGSSRVALRLCCGEIRTFNRRDPVFTAIVAPARHPSVTAMGCVAR